MHEQDPVTHEVWTHQHHYVPQIKEIPVDAKALVLDEEPADEDLSQLFMSLVGALAWLILTMPSICIYVAYLQRQTKAPTLGHIRRANRLLRWTPKSEATWGALQAAPTAPPRNDAVRQRIQGPRLPGVGNEGMRHSADRVSPEQ